MHAEVRDPENKEMLSRVYNAEGECQYIENNTERRDFFV